MYVIKVNGHNFRVSNSVILMLAYLLNGNQLFRKEFASLREKCSSLRVDNVLERPRCPGK